MKEIDRWCVDGEVGDSYLAMEDEGEHFHADLQGFGLEKGRGAECGIIGDGDVLSDEAALQEGEGEMGEGDGSAERCGELSFKRGTEGVGVDEERNEEDEENDEDRATSHDLEPVFLHWSLRATPYWLAL